MKKLQLQQLKSKKFLELSSFERAAGERGFKRVAGVDEAGRGPLAGPVVAAACILPDELYIDGIDDSKALSAEMREAIFEQLVAHPEVYYGIGVVEALMIDQINILRATLQAMAAAIVHLRVQPDFVLVDGNQKPNIEVPCETIVRGDSRSQSIMAAAIIAKVTRDRKMVEYDREFPQYGFASHKGYPTPEHLEALEKWGPCAIHRRSYAPVRRVLV